MLAIQPLLQWANTLPPLPWQNKSPYQVWLSEIMLQQTTLATVLNRWEQWCSRFPTLESLAEADLETVLQAWEGLGYYSRAKNLHLCAKIVAIQGWPNNYEAMRKLPGIGDYTACTLLSAFYNQPYLALDANVKRILMRQLMTETLNKTEIEEQLKSSMQIYGSYPINFALIRLGQLVCKARDPQCLVCIIQDNCLAYRQNKAHSFPPKKVKKITLKHSLVALFCYEDSLWVFKQEEGIGKGMFSLPRYSPLELEELTLKFGSTRALTSLQHHYTHFNEKLNPYLFNLTEKLDPTLVGEWVSFKELQNKPFLSVYRKIIDEARAILRLY